MKENLNSFYYRLLNISKSNLDIEESLVKVIQKHKQELLNRTEDVSGFCKYLSYNIGDELNSRGINVAYLNINELTDINYDHYFLVAYNEMNENINYYLIDPTYEQFLKKENHSLNPKFKKWPSEILNQSNEGKRILKSLISNGYVKITNKDINTYLSSFSSDSISFELDSVMINNRRPKQ